MAKNTELETMEKIKKLSSVIETDKKTIKKDTEKPKEKNNYKKEEKKKKHILFKTSDVVLLMIVTMIVSLVLGGIFQDKIFANKGEKVDKELQNFINDYEYIVENYSGDLDKSKILDAALQGMLSQLDKNSIFLDKDIAKNFNINLEGSYDGVGIEIYQDDEGFVISRVFDGSSADKAGLEIGDIIVAYNGKEVKDITINDFVKKVDSSKKINITYLRNGERYDAQLSTGKVTLKSVASKTFNRNGKKIGYIRISIFASNTYKQFKEEFNKLKKEKVDALAIDLRSNSGGYLSTAENIISLFLDSSHPIYQIEKDGKKTKHYSKGMRNADIKVALIVNESSASASEVLTSALSEQYKATIIGKKTFGKGTVQELQDLTDGNKYKITTKNWLTSKGVWVNEKGIKPDIEVDLSQEYINDPTEDKDNQLQKALDKLAK